jgi:hypothetical protein
MWEVAGSTPGLDFYILCEPICVSLCLFQLELHMFYIDLRWPFSIPVHELGTYVCTFQHFENEVNLSVHVTTLNYCLVLGCEPSIAMG